MDAPEYLVSFGLTGEFGRFRSAAPLALRRGERVVVRGPRGVEMASVLCPATPRHAHFLPNTTVGQLLRRASEQDVDTENAMQARGQRLFERGQQLALEMDLPLELLDVEVLLDGEHAVLHLLRWADADVRPFVSTLSRAFELHITLADLARAATEEAEPTGCGRPDCGQQEGGGCSACGSGGGCNSCGSAKPQDMTLYFAQLREQMEHRRTTLL